MTCLYKLANLQLCIYYRKSSYQLNVKRLNTTANRTYERAQSELQIVKGKKLIYFIYQSLFSLTWLVEEFAIPIKYKEMFSDLSDVEIPLETMSIGMELGEGTISVTNPTLLLHNLHVVFSIDTLICLY